MPGLKPDKISKYGISIGIKNRDTKAKHRILKAVMIVCMISIVDK
jgi:hypothetical protein